MADPRAVGHAARPAATSLGSISGLAIALVITGVAIVLIVAAGGGSYLRRAAQLSHRHREESADAHAQAQNDFVKLGEAIQALDIDSSLATASPQGKDEYRHAIGCYEAAERRLKHSNDAYQFQKAVWAIEAGLRHCHAADQLFNPKQDLNKDIDNLARLAELHRSGALTDAEFAEQKAKLIN